MGANVNFHISLWDTSESVLCPKGDKPGWRWKVTTYREGFTSRAVYKEGCEDTLLAASFAAQTAVRDYGREN